MKTKTLIISLFLLVVTAAGRAQSVVTTEAQLRAIFSSDKNIAGSVYRTYPNHVSKGNVKAPKGYKVVYISHYGRHGSRWLPEDSRYENLLKIFDENELTPLGKEVRRKLEIIWQDAKGCGGDLTRVGERQHNQIAHRMAENFKQLFKEKQNVRAVSSTVRRCMMSMTAFCEGLKEIYPTLYIEKEAHERTMSYINYESPELKKRNSKSSSWYKHYEDYQRKTLNTTRLISSLFANPDSITNQIYIMEELYWVVEDVQNTTLSPSEVELTSIFTDEELYAQWRCINNRMYMAHVSAETSSGIPAQSANSLLFDIVAKADVALSGDSNIAADLRFGHDSALIRLLTRMNITGTDASIYDETKIPLQWQDFRVSPMAANIQLIFYRNKNGKVLVRFMLNENPVTISKLNAHSGIFYDWEEVKNFWVKSQLTHN